MNLEKNISPKYTSQEAVKKEAQMLIEMKNDFNHSKHQSLKGISTKIKYFFVV